MFEIQAGSAESELASLDPDAGLLGTPSVDAAYWHEQTTPFTCAVVAQGGIINELTGQHLSEAELTYEATAHHWLDPAWGGTRPEDGARLLELHGIATHSDHDGTIDDLAAELAAGHKVIAGVNGKILHGADPVAGAPVLPPDHAVWVIGIDNSDPDHGTVLVNDSGLADGAGKAVDLDQFQAAWDQAGAIYYATDGMSDFTVLPVPPVVSDGGMAAWQAGSRGLLQAISDNMAAPDHSPASQLELRDQMFAAL